MLHLNCTAFSQLELSTFFCKLRALFKKLDFYYFFHKFITIYVLFEKIKSNHTAKHLVHILLSKDWKQWFNWRPGTIQILLAMRTIFLLSQVDHLYEKSLPNGGHKSWLRLLMRELEFISKQLPCKIQQPDLNYKTLLHCVV